jgi:phosphomannomutase
MATIKKPFSEIYQEVKEASGYISTYIYSNLKVPNKKNLQKALMKFTPAFSYKPVSKSTKDGVKYVFEDGSWVLMRFSGTENALRYYMEFSTEIECERNKKAVMNFIDKYGK